MRKKSRYLCQYACNDVKLPEKWFNKCLVCVCVCVCVRVRVRACVRARLCAKRRKKLYWILYWSEAPFFSVLHIYNISAGAWPSWE